MSISAAHKQGAKSVGLKAKTDSGSQYELLDKAFLKYLSDVGLAANNAMVSAGSIVSSFPEAIDNHLLMVQIIKKGVTYPLFEEIQKLSSLTGKDWAEILNISFRSLQRYKEQNQLFKPIQSEKILELGELFILGNEVFGDAEKFKLWLEMPNFALGKMKPSSLLSDSYGQDLVVSELNRISHGILA
ncbi:MAG: DUF2384 domain-containing protein [Saprospiraceae bacterium]|nr:DUF2384 domain-containing protein [Candidatus Opimibacter iunctus]